MASSREFIGLVLDSCEGLSVRAMMGDFVLYYNGKVVGGIYDNRLLIKPTNKVKTILPNAEYQKPYDGAKDMILIEDLENRDLLKMVFSSFA